MLRAFHKIYCSGHISGLTYKGCTDWYKELQSHINSNIMLLAPMRFKQFLNTGEIIQGTYEHELFGTTSSIYTRDIMDVRNCDMVVANLDLLPNKVSIGTVVEIAVAVELRIPVVLIMKDPKTNVHNHPFITKMAGWIVPDVETAGRVINGVCGEDYSLTYGTNDGKR